TGMFIQSIMIAARQFGLETIPQAALANYHEVLRARLSIPDDQMVICGMGIGYPDVDAKVNTFTTEREPLENFVTWIDALKQTKGRAAYLAATMRSNARWTTSLVSTQSLSRSAITSRMNGAESAIARG